MRQNRRSEALPGVPLGAAPERSPRRVEPFPTLCTQNRRSEGAFPRSPSVPQAFPGTGVDPRSPVPLPIRERGTGNGQEGITTERRSPDPCNACGRPLVAAKSRRTGLCAGCHAEHGATPRGLRPLDPDAFPEDMRQVVRWHLLFVRADELTARTGLGLASVWGHVKRGNYAAALVTLEQIEADR